MRTVRYFPDPSVCHTVLSVSSPDSSPLREGLATRTACFTSLVPVSGSERSGGSQATQHPQSCAIPEGTD